MLAGEQSLNYIKGLDLDNPTVVERLKELSQEFPAADLSKSQFPIKEVATTTDIVNEEFIVLDAAQRRAIYHELTKTVEDKLFDTKEEIPKLT